MTHILRKFTAAPGRIADVSAITDKARWSADFPSEEIIGSWTSEIGKLNQLVVLSSDVGGREKGSALPQDGTIIRSLLSTEAMFLDPQRPISWKGKGHSKMLYELRQYQFTPGGRDPFFSLFGDIVPLRETYSELVAWWKPISGNVQQMVHLWVYDSFEHRTEVRAKCMTDPKWAAYLGAVFPFLGEMHSTLLIPTANSPLQ